MAVKKTVRPTGKKSIPAVKKKENIVINNEEKSKEAIAKYQEYLISERNYSEYTINSYISDICEFKDFLTSEDMGTLITARTVHARNFMTRLFNNEFKKKSIARKLSSLKTFYRYLITEKIVSKNPFELIESPKVEKSLPRFLYKEEIEKIDVTEQLKDYALKTYVDEAVASVDVSSQLVDYAKSVDVYTKPEIDTKHSTMSSDISSNTANITSLGTTVGALQEAVNNSLCINVSFT